MTFSGQIREEICRTLHDKERKYACLYGIFLYARTFSKEKIIISSESELLMKVLEDLVESVFKNNVKAKTVKENKKIKNIFSFIIDDEKQVDLISSTYKINPENREIDNTNMINGGLAEFLAGVFLCCGSIVDPNKGYRLEFNTPTSKLCESLKTVLNSFGFKCGTSERKNSFIIYIENSENIEDLLTFMGAQQCTIDLINIKIYKNFRNKTNRITNCDFANLNKTVSASVEQIRIIKNIEKHMKLDDLPKDLYEIAVLRLENRDAGLAELGEMLEKPIGKSGVSRRFQRLKAIEKSFQENCK